MIMDRQMVHYSSEGLQMFEDFMRPVGTFDKSIKNQEMLRDNIGL